MAYAILVAINPRNITESARTRLGAGKWKFVCEGLVDSRLTLHHHDESKLSLGLRSGAMFDYKEPTIVSISIAKAGQESCISIYAEPA